MEPTLEPTLIFALSIIVLLLVYHYLSRLVLLRNICTTTFAVIDVQFQTRRDLVLGVLETVRKHTQQEQDVFENVKASCARAVGADAIPDKIDVHTGVNQSLLRLVLVARNYPQIIADDTFTRLQTELHKSEKVINAARRLFNNATTEYNAAVKIFPTNIMAKIGGFKAQCFFDPEESQRTAVFVDYRKTNVPAELGINEVYSSNSDGNI